MTENLSLKLLNFDTKVSSNDVSDNQKSEISEKKNKKWICMDTKCKFW